MTQLTDVSETALITFRSRVNESGKTNPILQDPVGEECLKAMLALMSDDLRKRVMERKLNPVLSLHIALRARKYDNLCREFLEEFPEGLIVNLGAGFDTRFWRLGGRDLNYLELDLPGVIAIKRQVLKERVTFSMIEGSVLEEEWITKVKEIQATQVLFIAEGLFMYLPKDLVIKTLKRMGDSFKNSRLIMEVIAEKYTRGIRKKMVERKIQRGTGTRAGDYYQFGIREAGEVESYHPGFRVKGEWSYFEDKDLKPAFLQLFRYSKLLSKTQYTVISDLNQP